ncbi:MAG: alpha/beta hydrolase [bacterium]|nr:alpha/beta hydrolase [bacterium]
MESYHKNSGYLEGDNVRIHFRSWDSPSPKAVIIILHAHGEHSGRYSNIVNALSHAHISFYALDYRGHGLSSGKRGHVNSFRDYVSDVKLLIDFVKQKKPGLPCYFLAHSMGALVALKYTLAYPDDISHLILSAPFLIFASGVPLWKKTVATFLSAVAPRFSLVTGIDPAGISQDKSVVDEFIQDPLVHDRVTVRFYTELIKTCKDCMKNSPRINKPLMVFHGKEDPMAHYRGSEFLYNTVISEDKKLYLFESLLHETMNEVEPERKKVLNTVRNWVTHTMQ